MHQIEYNEDDVKDQIEMFSLQIANENLQFSAAGFFPIDYTLVFSVRTNDEINTIYITNFHFLDYWRNNHLSDNIDTVFFNLK